MLIHYPKEKEKEKENQLAFFAALFTLLKLASRPRLKQNQNKIYFFLYVLTVWGSFSVTLLFWANICCQICVLPSQLEDVIRSGTLLYGVSTRNSTPSPISTQNRNSTRAGAGVCVWRRLCAWILKGERTQKCDRESESGGGFKSNQSMGDT